MSDREVQPAMMKCPFCQYDNEDGALFCEQCKSDLGVLEGGSAVPAAAVPVSAEATPVALAEESPFPEIVGSVPMASPVDLGDVATVAAGAIPVARPVILSRETGAEDVEKPLALTAESGV